MSTLIYELHYTFSPLLLVPLAVALGFFFSPQLSRWIDSARDEPRHPDPPLSNRERYILSGLFLGLFLLFTANSAMTYHRAERAYEEGRYAQVTGVIEDHHKPLQGDPYERFTVNGVSFAYTDDDPGLGYCGPVIPGKTYRILYLPAESGNVHTLLRVELLDAP